MSSLRRRRPCSPAVPPLDDKDLLAEILLRLPPQPSSLPRASLVSKLWRLLVSDPRFLHRFRIHHRRSPPLLGCFVNKSDGLAFVPTTRVQHGCFSFQRDGHNRFTSLGCRHGLVLISDQPHHQFIVWDPVTGDQHQLPIPPGFDLNTTEVNGEVLRAAGGVHFRVLVVAIGSDGTQHNRHRAIACVYSSETGGWGNLVSTPIPILFATRVSTVPAVLAGDSLYWNLTSCLISILQFDLEKQSLAVIRAPAEVFDDNFRLMRADGGGLGLLFLPTLTAKLWKRKTGCHGIASWVLERSIQLDKLLSLNPEKERVHLMILGFAEENNVVFLSTSICLFEVHLQSLQFKKLSKTSLTSQYHPFESVYTAEIGGEHDGAEHLHNA